MNTSPMTQLSALLPMATSLFALIRVASDV
jgi:hypothetical protein